MDIQELIQNAIETLKVEEACAAVQRRIAEQEAEEQREQEQAAFRALLMDTVPELLHPYIDLSGVDLTIYGYDRSFPAHIDGCTGITVLCARQDNRSDSWHLKEYFVSWPTGIDRYHCTLEWSSRRFGPDDLERALGTAALAHQAEVELQAQLDEQRAEHEAREAAWTAEQEAFELDQQAEHEEREAKEEAELQRVFELIRNDSVALALVRAFAAYEKITGHMDEILSRADDDTDSIESRYQERLDVARADAQHASDEARDLERRAWDAEEKVRQMEREAKQAQRGW